MVPIVIWSKRALFAWTNADLINSKLGFRSTSGIHTPDHLLPSSRIFDPRKLILHSMFKKTFISFCECIWIYILVSPRDNDADISNRNDNISPILNSTVKLNRKIIIEMMSKQACILLNQGSEWKSINKWKSSQIRAIRNIYSSSELQTHHFQPWTYIKLTFQPLTWHFWRVNILGHMKNGKKNRFDAKRSDRK